MQDEPSRGLVIEHQIESLNILQQLRAFITCVLEVDRPLNGGEILVVDGDAADFQSGRFVRPLQEVLDAVFIESAFGCLTSPGTMKR